jgi:exodeoxyribonuclease V alpha subunit
MSIQITQSAKDKMLEAIRLRAERRAAEQAAAGQVQQVQMAGIKLAAKVPEVMPATSASPTVVAEIIYNAQQQSAIDFASSGQEFCLIGAAGTGKTTTVKEIVRRSVERICKETGKKLADLGIEIALLAFTRRAVRNIAKAVKSINCEHLCNTAHAFLEYQPVEESYIDENGLYKMRKVFRPMVTEDAPNRETRLIIIDESSMLGYSTLYKELVLGCPNAKFIFIGDLNQLPPVFGDAVLGYKLAQLPVVELNEVYRQAMDSPIIWFQHNYTLKGNLVPDTVLEKLSKEATPDSGVEFIPFKQKADWDVLSQAVANYMLREYNEGRYSYKDHTFLIPFNKKFGTKAINENFVDMLTEQEQRTVFEVIAGFEKKYLAVGDYIMHEKQEWFISDITPNPVYMGKKCLEESVNLNRWGVYRGKGLTLEEQNSHIHDSFDAEKFLKMTSADSEESAKMKASHIVKLISPDGSFSRELSAAGAIKNLEFAYCTTIHKSQGSEWEKVWLIVHKDHASMLSRELLYTGMTRAKSKLTVLYSPASRAGAKDSSINKALKRGVLSGVGWQAKVEAFKGKLEAGTSGWIEPGYEGGAFPECETTTDDYEEN